MEIVDQSQYVFVARIISAREVKSEEALLDRSYVEAEYELLELLQGFEGGLPFTLRSGYGGGDCGVPFRIGSQILVHTDDSGRIGVCSGSRYIVGDLGLRSDPVLESYRAYIQTGEPIEMPNESEAFEREMKELYCSDD